MMPETHLLFADHQKGRIETYCWKEFDLVRDRFIPAIWVADQLLGEPCLQGPWPVLCGDCLKAWVEAQD